MEVEDKIEKLLQTLNIDSGKFQTISCFLLAIQFSLNTLFIFSLPFLELYPDLLCNQNDGTWVSCSKEQVCESNLEFKYNWESITTIDNWIQQFDLLCAPSVQIGMIGSILFLSYVAGSFTFAWQGDVYGRKKLLIPLMTAQTMCLLITQYISSFQMLLAAIFFYGFFACPAFLMAYNLGMELASRQQQYFFTALKAGFCGFNHALAAVLFYYFRSGSICIYIYFSLFLVIILCSYFYLPESPKFLFDAGLEEQFVSAIQTIAFHNGVSKTKEEIYELIKQLEMHQVTLDNEDWDFEAIEPEPSL